MKRRRFLGSLSALMALGSGAGRANAGSGAQPQAATPGRAPSAPSGRTTAPAASYDVVVVGGGLAGVCAAIAAARHGATVALVTDRPVLGGNCSSECRTSPEGNGEFYPWAVATGLIKEIVTEDRLRNPEPLSDYRMTTLWDLTLYEFVRREAPRLELSLNTSVREAVVAAGRIAEVRAVQLGTEKQMAFAGSLFIDATGQGTLGALAGADYHYGRESRDAFGESLAPAREDRQAMGSTLFFRARDLGRDAPFTAPAWAAPYDTEAGFKARRHQDPEGGYWFIEIGAPFHTIDDNERIRHELLRHVLGIWDHLKNHCGEVARERTRTLALDFISPITYRREGRRLRGDVVVSQRDLQERRLFEDRVAFGGWFIDLHEARGLLDEIPEALAAEPDKIDELGLRPYPLPLGALYSRNIENLLMAGRTVSTTHVAFGATRIQQTCAVLGQAAGTAAALCARARVTPRTLRQRHLASLQQTLLRDDFYVPFVGSDDPDDLARRALVTASSDAVFTTPLGTAWWPLEHPVCQILPVSAKCVETLRVWLRNSGESATVRGTLLRADDVWTPGQGPPIATAVADVPANHDGWVDLLLAATVPASSLVTIALEGPAHVSWQLAEQAVEGVSVYTRPRQQWINLRQRKNRWTFRASLVPESRPYGAENVTNGVARPERWTNLWIADPAQPWPQHLELAWETPVRIEAVQITFDHSLAREHQDLPGFHVYPECVRDYRVEVQTPSGWTTVVERSGNVHRLCRHTIMPVTTRRLRLVGLASNGAPSMRVYEIRAWSAPPPGFDGPQDETNRVP